ncbi:FAD binding domain-containing protein [Xylariaceae sp. FL1651]|nr:FAD binding domain-containing protein [Xylariaceae sp. FL1651]
MAKAVPPSTFENGFRQPSEGTPWKWEDDDPEGHVNLPSKELVSSTIHNDLGINVIRTWPTMYDGTNNPHGIPSWWKPSEKVDVLICGAGPSGLAMASSLARQGVSFRIIDKAEGPLIAGRADGVQPRFLETIAMWGLATEIHEEGPLIERTAIYKDGKKLLFNRSHQSDSRYRGLHIITQGQVERIYVRDLLRHRALVERSSVLKEYSVVNSTQEGNSHPVRATILNERTGSESVVQAKYLVGSDGAASKIRKSVGIPFDGVSTDIYWGIMDCIYDSDYPHAWVFGSVISSEHGGCVIIPREDGYIRLYTQLNISHTGPLGASRSARDPSFAEAGGNVDVHSITPEEVLEQANRIFSPYKLKFAAPLSWFAIWKISERVARSFSSPDMRVHLVGDAGHVHSVMGAFGLNASILDAANLTWKLGLAAKGLAKPEVLLPTYNSERRKHAVRIIEVSGTYLRFICGSKLRVPNLSDVEQLDKDKASGEIVFEQTQVEMTANNHTPSEGANGNTNGTTNSTENGTVHETANGHKIGGQTPGKANGHYDGRGQREEDLGFLANFFKTHGSFLLGVDCAYDASVASPARPDSVGRLPLIVKNGVRAPNPRVAFGMQETGYLYDKLAGPARFHIVVFASSLRGAEIHRQLSKFAEALKSPDGFYGRFGGASMFNVVMVVKMLPFEFEAIPAPYAEILDALRQVNATVVFDDRAPDEDAHTTWGANHTTGGVAVIRPDLWVGVTAFPEETERVEEYLGGFLHRL